MPWTGQPVMLRTVSPQPPAVVTPERLEVREDVGQLRELEPVELDVLAGRELAVALAVEVRDLADRAQLGGGSWPDGTLIRSMNVPIFGLSW